MKESFKTENSGIKFDEANGKSKEDGRGIEIMENTLKEVEGRFKFGLI